MRKPLQIGITAFILLAAVLIFFTRAYKELIIYSDRTNRHNIVHAGFQNLSKQITNAAVLNPDLIKATGSSKQENYFLQTARKYLGN